MSGSPLLAARWPAWVVAAALLLEGLTFVLIGRSDYFVFFLVGWADYSYEGFKEPLGQMPQLLSFALFAVLLVCVVATALSKSWARILGLGTCVAFLALYLVSLPSAYQLAMTYHPPPMGQITRFLVIYATGIPIFVLALVYYALRRPLGRAAAPAVTAAPAMPTNAR